MSKNWEKKFRTEDLQRLQEFRLMDDDFTSECFEENIEYTELALHIVLRRGNSKVKKMETQHFMKNLRGRLIILDIYATDETEKRYNTGIQKADRGTEAKRARYHSGLIDTDVTEPGDKLENLVETYVISITENGMLGKGKPLYHIDRVVRETNESFDDETHILYVNDARRDESPTGILMYNFSCADAKDMEYRILAERVRYPKEDGKGMTVMCKAMEDMRNEAKLEERKEIACSSFVGDELSYEKIAKHTGSTVEEIQKLATQEGA